MAWSFTCRWIEGSILDFFSGLRKEETNSDNYSQLDNIVHHRKKKKTIQGTTGCGAEENFFFLFLTFELYFFEGHLNYKKSRLIGASLRRENLNERKLID